MKASADRFVIKDSGFVMDLTSGHSFTANATGVEILRALAEGCSKDEIIERLRKEFTVDEHTVRRDVDEFLLELKVMHIHED